MTTYQHWNPVAGRLFGSQFLRVPVDLVVLASWAPATRRVGAEAGRAVPSRTGVGWVEPLAKPIMPRT
jgi:hypothetical protein